MTSLPIKSCCVASLLDYLLALRCSGVDKCITVFKLRFHGICGFGFWVQ